MKLVDRGEGPAGGPTDARVRVRAQLDTGAAQNAIMAQPGFTYSYKAFNLQLGVGYGNVFVPALRLVSAKRLLMPDLDVYFRF